ADWFALFVDQHGAVRVELDVAAVGATDLAAGAHDDGLGDLALLHARVRQRFLDRHDDHIAESGVAPARAAEHADAKHALCAAVVGHIEHGLLLNHGSDLFRAFDQACDHPALGA